MSYNDQNNYASQGALDVSSGKFLKMPTLKDRLAQAVAEAESRLTDARRAKDILDKHPELEELLNIMQKGRF